MSVGMRAETAVAAGRVRPGPLAEPRSVRWLLVGTASALLVAFVAVPLVAVFATALRDGPARYLEAIFEREAQSALRLTLLTAALVVPANTVFGVAAAWCIARLRFRGKRLLVGSIDLPLSVSPVVAGLAFVLLLGGHALLGRWLVDHGIRVIFATPGIVIAAAFVTVPYVAREVLAVLEAQGSEQEAAALTLGASGWQTFLRITLPKIRWGLLYGVALCAARAMGEFGAVSVVSGHVRGETVTLPLHAQILYDQYDSVGAFAAASLLTAPALVTLLTKKYVEWRSRPA
jgi:sulfate/thiosulfate transport system permease protein